MKEISIVIPVYNSEECVEELSRQISDALKGIEYEQIMVNDCSRDKSWQKICSVISAGYPVKGVNLRKNAGQDNAIFVGLEQASGKYVVVMDDDLQHSPYDILKLYTEIQKGYDVCYADFPQKKQRLWKNLGSWLNGKIAEILIAKPRGLYLSPFKIIKLDVVKTMARSNNLFPYIDGLLFQVTRNITQIPIQHHKREMGKSNYNLIKSIAVFGKLLFGFSIIPLRLSSVLGALSAFAGFILGIYYFIQYQCGHADVTGWTTIVLLILIIGGLNLLSLGAIGEYIGRSYLTLNNSPRFSVAEIKTGKGLEK